MTMTTTMRWTLLATLALLAGVYEVQAACVMTGTCVNPGNVPDYDACIPEANPMPVDPKPMTGAGWANVTGGGACTTDKECNKGACVRGNCVCQVDGMTAGAHCDDFAIQCPEYKDAACCSWQQNQALAQNFKLVTTIFGKNSVGGCDACATNLLELWCGMICSPRQSEFMKMHLPYPSNSYRPDPMTGKDHVKVLEMDVTLAKDFTCAVFDSCKNTAIASVSEAMKSSLGFLNYQMQTGAIGHGEYMHLHFNATSNATAFDHPVLNCGNYSEVEAIKSKIPTQAQLLPSIASPTEAKQCPCGACRATCDAHSSSSSSDRIKVVEHPISIWDGFNTKLVAIIYGVAAVLLIGLQWTK
ncbi:hypothetical protein Poli38472_009150 [Pythium oligandrum]|uniref:Niemann-Pick C1 N-terminal domain-containing protein n=1 Tax=Pythium oligandrum TaxID=41045 RepID=A0A8K1CL61_PYTOL|nr:hypothetical protein Poli38472_009150 [Pythium oligandrum]|eukprot:TMW64983.1 hypothetical protein Poli38472_009150 [Pythium oligandrum]